MTKEETLVRYVLGPCRRNIRPFAYAMSLIIQRSFAVDIPIEDILVTRDIYPDVGRMLHIRPDSVARQIERIANDCWNIGDRQHLYVILGKKPLVCPPPREMLFYFAAFSFYGVPYQKAMEDHLAPMF